MDKNRYGIRLDDLSDRERNTYHAIMKALDAQLEGGALNHVQYNNNVTAVNNLFRLENE